jgi:hypothetical protein
LPGFRPSRSAGCPTGDPLIRARKT